MGSGMDRKPFASEDNLCVKCNKKCSLTKYTLINLQTFDDLLELAEQGDHREVDMLVKDIYGGAYSSIGLSGDIIASSFGKAARSPKKSGV